VGISDTQLRVVARQPGVLRSAISLWGAAVGAFTAMVAISAWDGAYFPSAWGFCALVACWITAVALLLDSRPTFSGAQLATVLGFTALMAWIALSIIWSDDRPQSVLEVERGLVYTASLLAMILLLRNRNCDWILGGALAGITAIAAYALSTRLLTAPGGALDAISLNRLASPIGYWNALAIFTVLGVLIALGFAARGRSLLSRSLAAGALPLLVTALYFTYSRGGWLSLGAGLLVVIAADPRRLELLATALALAPITALAVGVAATSHALTGLEASSAAIESEGRELTLVLVVLVGVSSAVGAGFSLAELRVRPAPPVRRAFAALLALAALTLVVAAFVRFGGPLEMARDGYHSFASDPPASTAAVDLNKRLFTLHSKGRFETWREAWHDYEAHRFFGSGAGSYEQYWLRHRESPGKVRDAHSLYLEVLTELGPVGLGLLAVSLGVPLVVGMRRRAQPLMPALVGAYVAYLVHAGVDWDWEIPAVTLTALLLAATLLTAIDHGGRTMVLRTPFTYGLIALLVAVGVFSVVGLVGNRAIADSQKAVNSARWRGAEREARTAIRWAPWAAQGWQALGNAQFGLGREVEARASLLKAARKDPRDWSIWYDLAVASRGTERRRAFLRAAELNPRNPNIKVLRDLGYGRAGTKAGSRDRSAG
jgi:O-antigen ligase/polysaccharide polymerase Wzy-like membrane protein